VKFEGDRSNPLEVMISQTQEFGKAIRPLFADPVTYIVGASLPGLLIEATPPQAIKHCQ